MEIYINARFLTQQITGVQRFAIEISKELRKMDAQVKFVSPVKVIHNDIASELGVIPFGSSTSHFWEQISLPRYLKRIGSPLLVNLCNTAPIFYSNKVVTIHDITYKLFPENFSLPFRTYYNFLIPRILQSSRKIITVSNFSKREILKHYKVDKNKIDVIYNAVHNKFTPSEKENCEKYILGVSSLSKHKNFDMLVKSFNKIKNKNLKLYIVGEKNRNLNYILTQGHNINSNVIFTGRVGDQELVELYSNAACFVFPSLYEGFGIPPLEAMASGTPVVASNAAAIPEVCGDAALYFNPLDMEDIAETILKIVQNDDMKKALINKGFKQIKKFSWEKSANKMINVINNI